MKTLKEFETKKIDNLKVIIGGSDSEPPVEKDKRKIKSNGQPV